MGPALLADSRLHGGLAQQSRGVSFREHGPSPVVAPCLARAQRQTAHALGHSSSLAGQGPRLASRRWARSTVCSSTATSQQQQQALATAETKSAAPLPQADVVWSLFSYCAPPGTKTVELMGEWSSWLEPTPMSRKHVEADFTALLPLRPGMYQYKFVVDGVWTTAPQEPVVMVNKAGMYNNYRLVCASVKFESQAPAAILGSWDSFTTALDLAPQQQPPAEDLLLLADGATGGATRYKLLAQVPQGQHMYSVVVRGTDGGPMIVSTPQPVVSREERSYQLFVNGLPTSSRLAMRYRHWRGDAPLTEDFQEVQMLNAPVPFGSRASWKFAAVPTVSAPPAPPPPSFSGLPDSLNAALNDPLGQRLQGPGMPGPVSVPESSLEFYLTVADSEVSPARDVRPKEGGETTTWRLRHASGFKLAVDSGMLRPYRRACKPRMLLCADIDGTMIGDPNCPGGFSSTERFTGTWEESNLPLGSVLAYNTGRSIGMVTDVLRMAGPARMPTPDVVITAVGTKVFRQRGPLPGTYGYGFPGSGTASGGAPGGANGNGAASTEVQWEEDVEWTRSLDPGWDLNKVRQLVWDQVRRHEGGGHQHHHNRHAGGNGANGGQQQQLVKVIDNGEEHRHRVALIAHHRVADAVRGAIAKGCSQAGLDVNLILSGAGEYRFIDCVPVNAGKEQALQYIRKLYNVPQELTVAAGDSGNDMLMLAGPHPAIVVGNAQAELLQWAVSEPLENDGLVYTTAHIADGVLEGLARLDLL